MRDLLRRALTEEGYAVDGPQALALTDVAAFDAMVEAAGSRRTLVSSFEPDAAGWHLWLSR
ncbi:hypothetical protein ACFY2M_38910 [Streptomyces sp. NPDC001276]